jgi:spoIIIJ-associated protein
MSDPVFLGRDVNEALRRAAQALGQREAELRYVVLEHETEGRLGLSARPARIAVLLGAGRARAEAARPTEQGLREADSQPTPPQNDDWLERIVAGLSTLAGGPIEASWAGRHGEHVLRLSGAGTGPLLDGEGRVLDALEHLLGAVARTRVGGPHLRLACDGFREVRDAWLQKHIRDLCAQVRADGQPREMEPLNAYERRIVHMTVAEGPGLRSYSVGEGRDRHVTISVVEPSDPA